MVVSFARDKPANTARPQRFAIHGEYAVACEGPGSNNAVYACPRDLTDGPSASGVRTRWLTYQHHDDFSLEQLCVLEIPGRFVDCDHRRRMGNWHGRSNVRRVTNF